MDSQKVKTTLAVTAVGLFTLMVFGLLWFFFLGPTAPVGIGWYLFSFAAGLSMIVLPCTLPLAFVIVPLSMGKGPLKGLGIALSFGLGVSLMLSMYGVIAAVLGKFAIGAMGAPLEVVKNWLYFLAGLFAYLFALGELGLLNFRMPTYTGAAPGFIQKQQDFIKAFLLGIFMGNIGVGCPHPATPVILTRIAVSGDIFYGWLLFFIHAVGRVLPLLLLAILGILGVNALSWLVARKDKVEKATGWGMVFVAGFILVLGLFTHDWWVFSGQHTILEELTQEEKFLGAIISHFKFAGAPHVHGMPTGTGLFGLPLALGNWVLVLLWIVPVWWALLKRGEKATALPEDQKKIEQSTRPLWYGFAALFTLVAGVITILILPDRFFTHTTLHMLTTNSASMNMTMPMSMPVSTGSGTMNSSASMSGMVMNQPVQAGGAGMAGMPGMAGMSHTGMYHESADIKEGLDVSLNMSPVPVKTIGATKLDFFVHNKPDNAPVTNLELAHTKYMHVIGIRDDMNEFFHIHPETTKKPGVLSIAHKFAKPGQYKLFSEVQVAGVDHIFGLPILSATGSGETSKKEVSFAKSVIADNYQVTVDYGMPVVKNVQEGLTIDIHDAQGKEVPLEEYLGTFMHFSVIKDDLSVLIHTHPNSYTPPTPQVFFPKLVPQVLAHGGIDDKTGLPIGAAAHGLSFLVTLPTAGTYKAFAQFRPRGSTLPPDEAITATFWLKVEETAPKTNGSWWGLLIISLGAIGALSFITHKYITVVSDAKEKK